MDHIPEVTSKVTRTRQIALLLSDADKATALAYAAELESAVTFPPAAPAAPIPPKSLRR